MMVLVLSPMRTLSNPKPSTAGAPLVLASANRNTTLVPGLTGGPLRMVSSVCFDTYQLVLALPLQPKSLADCVPGFDATPLSVNQPTPSPILDPSTIHTLAGSTTLRLSVENSRTTPSLASI